MSKPTVTHEEFKHLEALFSAWRGLKSLGWEEPRYFKWPKSHEEFELIELGSTGIHRAVHFGNPGEVCWVDYDWPSQPFLVRHLKETVLRTPRSR